MQEGCVCIFRFNKRPKVCHKLCHKVSIVGHPCLSLPPVHCFVNQSHSGDFALKVN